MPVKKIFFLLMFISAAHHAFAADNRLDVASVDSDHYRRARIKAHAPAVKEMFEYYEVKGMSEDELRSELCRNGCKWKDGKTYDSVTKWHVKWDYDYDRAQEACSADSFKVFVDITYRYPKWVRTENVPQVLVDKWSSYFKSLVEHETGHRDMAVAAVEDLTRTVADMPAARTCAELDRKVQALCHERMQKLNDEAREYDVATNHGGAQGAVFP